MSGPADRLRIGDAERERAQAALSDHYAAGRLDHDEYTERLDRIWAARTHAELDPVFDDLPGHPAPVRSASFSTPASRSTATPRRHGRRVPFPLLVVLVVLLAMTVATHLPLILIGLGVWFVFFRGCGVRRTHTSRHW